MKSERQAIVAASATYIGTVVGAGFASGQEVLQFFGLLGPRGVPAIILATAGFFVYGYATMELGRKTQAGSHLPVFRETSGTGLALVLDVVTTFFLFGALSAMVAGSGSVVAEELSLPWILGAGLMAAGTLATVAYGLDAIVRAVSAIVPLLILSVVVVSVGAIASRGLALNEPPPGQTAVIKAWPVSSASYVSYNILMSVPILAALGSSLRTRAQAATSAFIGAVGLGAALMCVYLAVVSSMPEVLQYEVPVAHLAAQMHPLGRYLYVLVFLAEVYTTAVANLYGFSARVTAGSPGNFRFAACIACILSIVAARAGFSNLVRLVYPAVGLAGMTYLLALSVYPIRNVLRRRRPR